MTRVASVRPMVGPERHVRTVRDSQAEPLRILFSVGTLGATAPSLPLVANTLFPKAVVLTEFAAYWLFVL
jgi:hypothetical protein